ncbi:MAG: copper amine oxidase N-terminal domain-containing protein [Candidatus Niameybacter stercoravium]|nr:copper amine oxidase N-terminal domain-containing protein [Candidatus Niameybacter stercoravium]
MKKYQLWIGALCLILGTTIYAQDISIYMDSKSTKMDVAVQLKENSVYVPISFIAKALGAEVKWEDPKVIITKGDDQIVCTIGSKVAYKNGSQVQLDKALYLANNRTFMPLRSIGELLDCTVDYQKENQSIYIEKRINDLITSPKIVLLNHNSNYVTIPRKWNGQVDDRSIDEVIGITPEAGTNIYRPQVNETFKVDFGKPEPDKVTVKMAYLNQDVECVMEEEVPVIKNGHIYEFIHQPIPDPEDAFGGRVYSIQATWGDNICEYAFIVDNKWNFIAYDRLEEKMKALHVLDYCVVGNWVYYVTLGDQEGFHKMLLDGTQDTVICDFSQVGSLNGSTSVTSEYKGDSILYKVQQLRQYDGNGQLDPERPAYYYKLDLQNHTLEPVEH